MSKGIIVKSFYEGNECVLRDMIGTEVARFRDGDTLQIAGRKWSVSKIKSFSNEWDPSILVCNPVNGSKSDGFKLYIGSRASWIGDHARKGNKPIAWYNRLDKRLFQEMKKIHVCEATSVRSIPKGRTMRSGQARDWELYERVTYVPFCDGKQELYFKSETGKPDRFCAVGGTYAGELALRFSRDGEKRLVVDWIMLTPDAVEKDIVDKLENIRNDFISDPNVKSWDDWDDPRL